MTPEVPRPAHDFSETLPRTHADAIVRTYEAFGRKALEPWVVVGSQAVAYWAALNGAQPNDAFNDCDIVTPSLGALTPDMNDDFMFAHRHQPNAEGRHWAFLIHRATGIGVDMFTWHQDVLTDPVEVPLGSKSIWITNPAEQTMALIGEMRRRIVESNATLPPKLFNGVTLLHDMVSTEAVEELWARRFPSSSRNAYETLSWAQAYAFRRPYRRMGTLGVGMSYRTCQKCDHSNPDFPLATSSFSGQTAALRLLMRAKPWRYIL